MVSTLKQVRRYQERKGRTEEEITIIAGGVSLTVIMGCDSFVRKAYGESWNDICNKEGIKQGQYASKRKRDGEREDRNDYPGSSTEGSSKREITTTVLLKKTNRKRVNYVVFLVVVEG